jgi:uncharacterized protein YyaL (SSP411 family)
MGTITELATVDFMQVDWYPWGDEAFEKARKLDIPIFLSSKDALSKM